MKIRDRYTRGIGGLGAPTVPVRKRQAEGAPSSPVDASDQVSISERGREIQRARGLALAAPEIRQELVDEIVGQMERGEYRVAGSDVVPRMIREHWMLAAGAGR